MLLGRSKMVAVLLSTLLLVGLVLSSAPGAFAQGGGINRANRAMIDEIDSLRVDSPARLTTRGLNPALADVTGRAQVVARLSRQPVALASDQRAQGALVVAEQDALIARLASIDPSATVLGRTRILLNAVMIEMDAERLSTLAADAQVVSVNPVGEYEQALSDTVPYIGATPDVQADANGGAGIKVAVLDSGIDFTHAAFGGPGTVEFYESCYDGGAADAAPVGDCANFFGPGAPKVKGGFDFVGEDWPTFSSVITPDPNPIDLEGHGTHVADIIGGAQGVAPGVDLYAVKVCSAVSSSCNGVALLLGMDFAADPNNDGLTDDRVDIINMSLGSSYGYNYFDDLAFAVENAEQIGILTVASAGNSADKPYITGTPAAAPSALSVAQTEVPSSVLPLLRLAGNQFPAIFQPWSVPPAGVISAPVVYDTTNAGTRLGCSDASGANPWVGTPLAGKVVLVDRGACSFSLKIANIAAAGGVAGIIGLVTPGEPFTGAFGGGTQTIPGYMVSQADANFIKAQVGQTLTIDPAFQLPLVGHMVGSSSRGPSQGANFPPDIIGRQFGQLIKPEIGAPGASISAVAGSGSGVEPFGGTSGAAPMVAGAAALLMASDPGIVRHFVHEYKARLMNTAETEIYNTPVSLGGGLAPITRIGGGEVRVDQALAANAAAWELNGSGAALSFGFVNVTRDNVRVRRTVEIKNHSGRPITYDIASGFRFEDDALNGAVTIKPQFNRVTVPAWRSRYFWVQLEIDGSQLRSWALNSGTQGANGNLLTTFEYDGYITFTDAGNADNNLHMAWHVLPRLSGNVSAPQTTRFRDQGLGLPSSTFTLRNRSVGEASLEAFSLIGENPTPPEPGPEGSQLPEISLRYLGYRTIPVPAGFCSDNPSFLLQFAINTWAPITHSNYPVGFEIGIDRNQDGLPDAFIFNQELGGSFAADGRNVVFGGPASGPFQAFFFTQHGTNSGNTILTVCAEQLGMTTADYFVPFDLYALSFDNYFTGLVTGEISGVTISPLGERFVTFDPGTGGLGVDPTIPANDSAEVSVVDFGPATSPSETGIMFMLLGGGANEVQIVRPR